AAARYLPDGGHETYSAPGGTKVRLSFGSPRNRYHEPTTGFRMLSTSLMLAALLAADPAEIPVWGDKIPGPSSIDPKNVPTLTIHLAQSDKSAGTAVVVCPGGGYSGRATDHEGKQVADWLNARGVHAFILKYRTANESRITPPLEPGPMRDVQMAI